MATCSDEWEYVRSMGIDIGSWTVKIVVPEDNKLILAHKDVMSHNPFETATQLMQNVDLGATVAIGYGIKTNLDYVGIRIVKNAGEENVVYRSQKKNILC